jgi:glucose-6-phosphate isomerase
VLDNVDPVFTGAALDSMNPKKTHVVVIAKSGSTAETIATFLIVQEWMRAKLGKKAASRISVVTSEGRGDLKKLATAEKYTTFHLPENVGGRFSVLSAVGLLPAALIDIDIRKVIKGAAAMTQTSWEPNLQQNIALRSALLHYLIWTRRNKTIQVAFPYSNQLWGTAFWFRQLWAESLGKARNRKAKSCTWGRRRWRRSVRPTSTRRCSYIWKARTIKSSRFGP